MSEIEMDGPPFSNIVLPNLPDCLKKKKKQVTLPYT